MQWPRRVWPFQLWFSRDPHPRSSAKDHTRCLEDRLSRWLEGNINSLLHEYRSIQCSLDYQQHQNHDAGKRVRLFEKLVSHGNVKAAIRLSTEQSGSGCLPLDRIQPDGRTVKDHLLDKHPIVTPASPSAISEHPPATEPHSVVFDRIDGPMIQSTAQLMSGSAGPSGLDARVWRRLCSSFHSASGEFCTVIAKLTRTLCSS